MEKFDHKHYLSTYVQHRLEESERLFYAASEETEPYKYKYQGRKVLEELSKDSRLIIDETNNDAYLLITNAIIHYGLGQNYFETEETSQAEKEFQKSLKFFSKIDPKLIILFSNYLQMLYNSLGILYTNREDFKNGLALFAKAEHLYELIHKLHYRKQVDSVYTKAELVQALEKNLSYPTIYKFFYQGGTNLQLAEKNYTLTLFYMAQAYTKFNLKEKAAKYCGDTMKRQYVTKQYELKDWCSNAISLADYFIYRQEFAQSQYLLLSALSVIPENKKKKLTASLQMAIGRHLLEFLRFNVEKYQLQQSDEKNLEVIINKKTIIFEGLKVDFLPLKVPKAIEEINSIFRQMNTQFKKALKLFVLDGFVSEYIQIVRDLSQGYKYLAMIEKDVERVVALYEKRKDLLELPHREINPKAFENYWQVK